MIIYYYKAYYNNYYYSKLKTQFKTFLFKSAFDPLQRPTHLPQRLRFGGFLPTLRVLLIYSLTYLTVSQKNTKMIYFALLSVVRSRRRSSV